MQIDWWTLGLQAINVIVLLWILQRFLFRPVAAIVADRQAEANRILDEAAAARDSAEAERTEAAAEKRGLASRRADALAAAKNEAEKAKAALLAEARAEADRLLAEARDIASREHREAEFAAAENARHLASGLASRVLDRMPQESRVAGFAAGLAEAVAGLPPQVRRRVAGAGTLTVTAARMPGEADAAEVRERLAAALGGRIAVTFREDPALIAGYELEAGNVVVRNSLAADLARIVKDLSGHDRAS